MYIFYPMYFNLFVGMHYLKPIDWYVERLSEVNPNKKSEFQGKKINDEKSQDKRWGVGVVWCAE